MEGDNETENIVNEGITQNNDVQNDIESNIKEDITDNIEEDDEVNITDSLESEITPPGFIEKENDNPDNKIEVKKENKKKENKKILDNELISTKVKDCTEDLEEILDHCVMKKNGLDMYYEKLTHFNNGIQTSVIFFSAVSSFIQSFSKDSPEMTNNVSTVTLIISTYSGFMLSISKYFKFDETKENVHNLRDRFSELHNRIKYYRDLMSPWENESYYKHLNEEKKIKEWETLINGFETEYKTIIEIKKELFASYEKIIDTTVARKYDSKFLDREVNYLRNKGKVEKKIRRVKKKYRLNNWRDGLVSRKRGDLKDMYDDEDEEDEEKQKCWYRFWYICCRKYCKCCDCKCCDKKTDVEQQKKETL